MKILVCGTRRLESYKTLVYFELSKIVSNLITLGEEGRESIEIIEGCCPNSADQYAEEWCKEFNVKNKHFPSNSGNYLKRNIEMVKECTYVLAFFDGFSYGTSHTIATAVRFKKPVTVIELPKIIDKSQTRLK